MIALFLSSYMPLFLLIGIRSVDRAPEVMVASGVLTVAGGLGTWAFLWAARRKPTGEYELLDVESRDGDIAAYAATYLLPFLTVFSGDWRDVLSLAAFITFLGVVYVRSRLIYVNPLLAVMGYHLWRVLPATAGGSPCETDTRWPRYLLADTQDLRKGQSISAYRVTPDLMLYEATKI